MWSAAILAGGPASRFGGRDKSTLLVEGRSIRERQLAEIAHLTDDVMVVGGAALPAWSGRTRLVADSVPGCGPLGGLHAALANAKGEATVVVACDMPYVSAPLLRHLLLLTREADVVVPRTEDGYHPLCAAYTRASLVAVASRLARQHLKVIDLFEDVRMRVVTAEEIDAFGDHRRLLTNVNTPADLACLEAFQGHEP